MYARKKHTHTHECFKRKQEWTDCNDGVELGTNLLYQGEEDYHSCLGSSVRSREYPDVE